MTEDDLRQTSFRLPVDLLEWIKSTATRQRVSQQELIVKTLALARARDADNGFDHRELVRRSEFAPFREALNEFANIGFSTWDAYFTVIHQMAMTAQHADCCDCYRGRIRHGEIRPENPRCTAWPWKIEPVGNGVKCHYLCACCGNEWTCRYARHVNDLRVGEEPGSEDRSMYT